MRGAGEPVHCFKRPCYWLDIGRHDDYATANEIFESRRATFLGGIGTGQPLEDHAWDATNDDTARASLAAIA